MSKKLNKLLSLPSSSSSSTAAAATTSSNTSSSPWPWPYCYQPRTLSFRHDAVFKTLNSVAYLDDTSDAPSTITTTEEEADEDSEAIVESLISSARAHTRLFFEPGASNSILVDSSRITTTTNSNLNRHRNLNLKISEPENPTPEAEAETDTDTETEDEAETSSANIPVFKEMQNSVALAMDSRDPYVDFRKSMEEMVEAHRVFKNNKSSSSSNSSSNNNSMSFEFLQELLCWYLRANEKKNHGYIFGAFVDLLVNIQASSFSSSTTTTNTCFCSLSPSSPLSFYNSSSSSCSSSLSTPCVSESDSGGGDHLELDKSRPRSSR